MVIKAGVCTKGNGWAWLIFKCDGFYLNNGLRQVSEVISLVEGFDY